MHSSLLLLVLACVFAVCHGVSRANLDMGVGANVDAQIQGTLQVSSSVMADLESDLESLIAGDLALSAEIDEALGLSVSKKSSWPALASANKSYTSCDGKADVGKACFFCQKWNATKAPRRKIQPIFRSKCVMANTTNATIPAKAVQGGYVCLKSKFDNDTSTVQSAEHTGSVDVKGNTYILEFSKKNCDRGRCMYCRGQKKVSFFL